jgi:hypothetical protein
MSDDTRRAERRTEREQNLLKQRITFLELQLRCEIERRSHVEQLLHECLRGKYYDEYSCSASWLRDVQKCFPPIEGEKR